MIEEKTETGTQFEIIYVVWYAEVINAPDRPWYWQYQPLTLVGAYRTMEEAEEKRKEFGEHYIVQALHIHN